MKEKAEKKSEEFSRFEDAVRMIVSAPKKDVLDQERKEKANRPSKGAQRKTGI